MHHPTLSGRRAFTLVELLVVVSIIALLISILLPSLSKARQSARTIKCSANQKQYATANQMYADDHEQYYVPIIMVYGDGNGWWYQHKAYRKALGVEDQTGINQMPKELLCPEMPSQMWENELVYRCYSKNRDPLGWHPNDPNNPMVFHQAEVKTPAFKVQMADGNDPNMTRWGAAAWKWETTGEVHTSDGGNYTLTYRHGDQANLQFFDGHVETRSIDEVWFNGNNTELTRLFEVRPD